jgi:hypothetical protein
MNARVQAARAAKNVTIFLQLAGEKDTSKKYAVAPRVSSEATQ